MKKILCATLLLTFCSLNARAQVSGNVVYENSGAQQGGGVTRRYPAYSTMTMEQVVADLTWCSRPPASSRKCSAPTSCR
jgi:hypothetical protein